MSLEGDRIQMVSASSSGTLAQARSGGIGDYVGHLTVFPENTSGGTVVLKDGTSGVTISAVYGTLTETSPRHVVVNAISRIGAWVLTVPANMHVTANGDF